MIKLRTSQNHLSFDLKSDLQAQSVQLNNRTWERTKMYYLCPVIEQWNTVHLFLNRNKHSSILKEIRGIRFPSLQTINLSGNHIQTIEGISKIDIPCLVNVYLCGNKLRDLSDLRKGNWEHLTSLWVDRNKVLNHECLSMMNSSGIETMVLDANPSDEEQSVDVRWMAKMKSNLLKLDIISRDRIHQNRIHDAMHRKSSQIFIQTSQNDEDEYDFSS